MPLLRHFKVSSSLHFKSKGGEMPPFPLDPTMRERHLDIAIYLTAAAAVAGALKWHYSTANVNELRWILAPTTAIVESISGTGFRFEAYWGYLSDDRTFLIAAPCAGVNFLIVCFAMLAVRKLRDRRPLHLFIFLTVAYGWTVIANAVRILIAINTRTQDELASWPDFDTLHRVEGILVYFVFLIALGFAAEKLDRAGTDRMKRSSLVPVAVPLCAYYAISLVLPILNGSFDSAKWGHFLSVLFVPLLVAVPLGLLSMTLTRNRRA